MSDPKPTITENEAGTFDGECNVDRCGFTSNGHPTRKAARDRLAEHQAEHDKADAS